MPSCGIRGKAHLVAYTHAEISQLAVWQQFPDECTFEAGHVKGGDVIVHVAAYMIAAAKLQAELVLQLHNPTQEALIHRRTITLMPGSNEIHSQMTVDIPPPPVL